MGTTAFALFANYERTPDKWPFGEDLYQMALKAISDERSQRQQSIRQFVDEWNKARDN